MASLSSELLSERCQQGLYKRSMTQDRLQEHCDSERHIVPSPTCNGSTQVLNAGLDSSTPSTHSKYGEDDAEGGVGQDIHQPAMPNNPHSRIPNVHKLETGSCSVRPATTDAAPSFTSKALKQLRSGQESRWPPQWDNEQESTSVHNQAAIPNQGVAPGVLPYQHACQLYDEKFQNILNHFHSSLFLLCIRPGNHQMETKGMGQT
jgi:hypothetical protein